MALEQHAIPTEVTTYEFRLVGDMTLKQFGWLAGGIMIAILLWLANFIPFFIRWPLIPTFAILGAAIAFIPYQGRGIDRWIVAFIKAIYSPTEFTWHKELTVPAYLQTNRPVTLSQPSSQKKVSVTPSQIEDYLETLTYQRAQTIPDELESAKLTNINNLLNPTNSANQAPQIISQTIAEPQTPTQATQPIQPIIVEPVSPPTNTNPTTQDPQVITQTIVDETISPEIEQNTPIIESPLYDETPSETTPSPNSNTTIIPNDQIISSSNDNSNPIASNSQGQEPEIPTPVIQAMAAPQEPINPTTSPATTSPNPNTFTSHHLPPPPTLNNIISGVVVDLEDKPLTGAIVEINTDTNQPVRALRTNQHGQFTIATPLSQGTYLISADKDDYQIAPQSITVTDQLVPPITLIGQSQPLPIES